jgi:hypothetical protein
VACGFLRWTLPEDPPPMLAIVCCSFSVDFGEWEVSTEPITLVLQSREGVLESVGKEDSVVARDQAAKIVETLSAFPGRRSEGIKSMLRQLEATSTPPPNLRTRPRDRTRTSLAWPPLHGDRRVSFATDGQTLLRQLVLQTGGRVLDRGARP